MSAVRVLIIDDEPSITEVLSMALTAEGHEVAAAMDGRAGIECLAAQPVDVVLLDVMMPRMDGFETLARLRELANHKDTPVIFMSAGTPDLANARQPYSGYLPKPFSLPTVLEAIEKATRGRDPPHCDGYTKGHEPH